MRKAANRVDLQLRNDRLTESTPGLIDLWSAKHVAISSRIE